MVGDPMERRLFVYGTLMRGCPNADLLSGRRDVRFLGPARCRGAIHDLGGYPGLVARGRAWVAGELYRCEAVQETLDRLDLLEIEAGFARRILPVRWRQGEAQAWVYVYAGPLDGAALIPGGSYKAWVRSRRGAAAGGP
jgi:gamma-glutamylcyclotransferase (GGCT)/AIG2-like uncharacterized protein YtfP